MFGSSTDSHMGMGALPPLAQIGINAPIVITMCLNLKGNYLHTPALSLDMYAGQPFNIRDKRYGSEDMIKMILDCKRFNLPKRIARFESITGSKGKMAPEKARLMMTYGDNIAKYFGSRDISNAQKVLAYAQYLEDLCNSGVLNLKIDKNLIKMVEVAKKNPNCTTRQLQAATGLPEGPAIIVAHTGVVCKGSLVENIHWIVNEYHKDGGSFRVGTTLDIDEVQKVFKGILAYTEKNKDHQKFTMGWSPQLAAFTLVHHKDFNGNQKLLLKNAEKKTQYPIPNILKIIEDTNLELDIQHNYGGGIKGQTSAISHSAIIDNADC